MVRNSWIQNTIAWLGAVYISLVYKSTRWQRVGWDIPDAYIQEGKGFITCFWHNRLLMGCFGWPGEKEFHMLISSHSDGQLIAKIVGHHGIKTIAGSRNHGGSHALRAMVKVLKAGHTVGITPDGPRGPCYSVSEGTLTVARLAKVDILPFTCSTMCFKKLKSWDRFRIALPFSKGVLMWGKPFKINLEQPLTDQQEALKHHLLQVCWHADDMMGIDDKAIENV